MRNAVYSKSRHGATPSRKTGASKVRRSKPTCHKPGLQNSGYNAVITSGYCFWPGIRQQILVYSDSLTWGIIPNTRNRSPFDERWPGVLENKLNVSGHKVRVIEDR